MITRLQTPACFASACRPVGCGPSLARAARRYDGGRWVRGMPGWAGRGASGRARPDPAQHRRSRESANPRVAETVGHVRGHPAGSSCDAGAVVYGPVRARRAPSRSVGQRWRSKFPGLAGRFSKWHSACRGKYRPERKPWEHGKAAARRPGVLVAACAAPSGTRFGAHYALWSFAIARNAAAPAAISGPSRRRARKIWY